MFSYSRIGLVMKIDESVLIMMLINIVIVKFFIVGLLMKYSVVMVMLVNSEVMMVCDSVVLIEWLRIFFGLVLWVRWNSLWMWLNIIILLLIE